MTSDDRIATKPDERIMTAEAAHPIEHVQEPADQRTDTEQSRQRHHEPEPRAVLFDETEARRLRERWTTIQSGFVDEPRVAVKDADALVSDVTKRLQDMFGNERTELERQWDRSENASTEDLRMAMQRYHAFFDRLLSI